MRAKIDIALMCLKPLMSLIKESGKRMITAVGIACIALYCKVSKKAKFSSGLTPNFLKVLATKADMMI